VGIADPFPVEQRDYIVEEFAIFLIVMDMATICENTWRLAATCVAVEQDLIPARY
jgi:hypothetical protein